MSYVRLLYSQKETAILHDRVYQAHGASSSPRPKFPFAAVGVKDSRTPEPTAPSQPSQGAATVSTTSTNVVTSAQPFTTTNPYHMRAGGGGGAMMGGATMTGGYSTQPVPLPGQPGQTGIGGGGFAPPITQPFVSQGPAIMQPSTDTYPPSSMPGIMQPGVPSGVPRPGGGVVSGSQPGRETTYPVDAPVTWNDPPAIVAKKVYTYMYTHMCM